jgi:hypothetical protein
MLIAFSLVGEEETATEERAMSERSISLEWRHHHNHKGKRGGSRRRQHTAVASALQSHLADFESVLAVLVGDAARTTHNSRFLWRLLGVCGDEKEVRFHHVFNRERNLYVIK